MKLYRRIVEYWLPVVLCMIFILWMSEETFSSQNTSLIIAPLLYFFHPGFTTHQIDVIHGIIRKSGHFAEYFVLGLLSFRAFRGGSSRQWSLRWALSAFLLVLLYAASDEFHQSFVPVRSASVRDAGIDSLGGIVSQLLIGLRYHCRKNRKSR